MFHYVFQCAFVLDTWYSRDFLSLTTNIIPAEWIFSLLAVQLPRFPIILQTDASLLGGSIIHMVFVLILEHYIGSLTFTYWVQSIPGMARRRLPSLRKWTRLHSII